LQTSNIDQIVVILKRMTKYSAILILYNPNSTGPSEKNARRLAKKLRRVGYKDAVTVQPTEYEGHAEELAYQMAVTERYALVVSSSGDGGYNEVINGTMRAIDEGAKVVTGLLPSGNANDHYKQMHKPYVVRQIVRGQKQHIDVLVITAQVDGKPWRRYAHSYIGFGLSSEIGKELNKVDLNSKNEVLIILKEFFKFQPFVIEIDDRKKELQSIIVSNVSKMSKILSLSKKARVDDGLFEVITSEPNKAKLITTIVKSATVGIPHEEQTDYYSFTTIDPLPVQLDGEVFSIDGNCPVEVTIMHKALSCVI
jgi:diacylglycerol kinase (ATP)